jgi:hypothetical protein
VAEAKMFLDSAVLDAVSRDNRANRSDGIDTKQVWQLMVHRPNGQSTSLDRVRRSLKRLADHDAINRAPSRRDRQLRWTAKDVRHGLQAK